MTSDQLWHRTVCLGLIILDLCLWADAGGYWSGSMITWYPIRDWGELLRVWSGLELNRREGVGLGGVLAESASG